MSYKGQVLRGEKWFHLCKDTKDEDKKRDIEIFLASREKVKEKKTKEKK
jgi:hypothetical protein